MGPKRGALYLLHLGRRHVPVEIGQGRALDALVPEESDEAPGDELAPHPLDQPLGCASGSGLDLGWGFIAIMTKVGLGSGDVRLGVDRQASPSLTACVQRRSIGFVPEGGQLVLALG